MTTQQLSAGLFWATLLAAAPVFAQQGQTSSSAQQPSQKRSATATRQRAGDRELNSMLDMLTRTYELNDDQRKAITPEVQKIIMEQRRATEPVKKELDFVQSKLGQYWSEWIKQQKAGKPPEKKPWEDPEFIKLRQRMEQLRQEQPFDWPAALERLEKKLPPAQVAKGKKRREEWSKRWEEWKRQAPQRRPAATRSAWQEYVASTISKYEFDENQANAARAVLKDVEERAMIIQSSQELLRQRLYGSTDPDAKRQLEALQAPFDILFRELQRRVEQLPTEEQLRKAKEAASPGGKPADAAAKKPGS